MHTLLRLPRAIAHYTFGSVFLLSHLATFGITSQRAA